MEKYLIKHRSLEHSTFFFKIQSHLITIVWKSNAVTTQPKQTKLMFRWCYHLSFKANVIYVGSRTCLCLVWLRA